MKNAFRVFVTMALLTVLSGPALAQNDSYSSNIASDPPATSSNPFQDFAPVHIHVNDVITFTLVNPNAANNAFKWHWDSSILQCAGYPDFDSPTFRCTAKQTGMSTVSFETFPVFADGSHGDLESNAISVFVDANTNNIYCRFTPAGGGVACEQTTEAECKAAHGTSFPTNEECFNGSSSSSTANNDGPYLRIDDIEFFQKYQEATNALRINICNTGSGPYFERDHGTLTVTVTIEGKTDNFAFATNSNVSAGNCEEMLIPNITSSFFHFDKVQTGYHDMSIVLMNKPGNQNTIHKNIYIIDPSQPLPQRWQEDSTIIAPPAAGYEDDVLVNASVYSNPFPDTDITRLSGKAAAELYRRAVIGGFPDGEFKGARDVNRAEAAKFLLLARFGTIEDAPNNGHFPDVLDNQWYTKYVVRAANRDIISGYPDGLFRPANTVNTAEFLKMLSLTFDLQLNMSYQYNDVPANSWFAPYAGIAQKYDLFPTRLQSNLMPEKELTREEVAIAIYQYLANR